MKKLSLIIVVFILGIGAYFYGVKNKESNNSSNNEKLKTQKIENSEHKVLKNQKKEQVEITEKSVFVPYWSVQNLTDKDVNQYEKLIYFGVAAGSGGIDNEESGYKSLDKFFSVVPKNKAYLTLRMLDVDENIKVLENIDSQNKIIADLISLSSSYDMSGIVLDLEMSVIPLSETKREITSWIKRLSEALEKENIEFSVALYGDTFYRARPYDVPKIGTLVDSAYVMAYDFHKSRGEPGPNFPMKGRSKYGYDMSTMMEDFTQAIPPEKLSVVYGMYGYNWTIGPQGKPLKQAVAQTLGDIRADYFPKCSFSNCMISRDNISAESNITYEDETGYKRVVWYEDEESVESKNELIRSYGVGKIGYWAWGYF